MKLMIWLGIFVGSTIGGWLGALIGHSWLSLWSILLGGVGSFIGIWAGYKVGKNL